MNAVVLDDERLVMAAEVQKIKTLNLCESVAGFCSADAALDYVSNNEVDIAFMDIEMGTVNGLKLAAQAREIRPELFLVFVTGFSQYSMQAFKIHADGYLLKPVNTEELRELLENALDRKRLRWLARQNEKVECKRIRIQTFGRFEVFVDDIPLHFKRSKSKELLAYLVDQCGVEVSTEQVAAAVFERENVTQSERSMLRNLLSDLSQTLEEVGASEFLIRSYNKMAVNCTMTNCDLYRYQSGDPAVIPLFHGEYMSQYSWAEYRTAQMVGAH